MVVLAGCFGLWSLSRRVTPPGAELLLRVLIGALTASALVGVLQVVFQIDTGSLAMFEGRANGLVTHPVYFGALMAAGAAMATWRVRAVRWWLWLPFVFVFAAGISLSGSRIALGAALLGVVVACVRAPWRRALAACATLAGGVVAGTRLLRIVESAEQNSALDRVGATGDALGVRLSLWRYGLDAASEKPLFGWGLGSFRQATQGRYSQQFAADHVKSDAAVWFDAHNVVIELLVATGVVGVCLGAAFAVLVGLRLRGELAVGVLAIVATWMFEPAGLVTLPLVMIMVGVGEQPRQSHQLPRRGATVALVVVGAVLALGLLTADLRLERASAGGDPASIESASAWFWRDPVAADLVAQSWQLEALLEAGEHHEEVVDSAMLATEFEPDHPRWWEKLALRHFFVGDDDAAIGAIREALELQPYRISAWQYLHDLGEAIDRPALVDEASRELCGLGVSTDACPD